MVIIQRGGIWGVAVVLILAACSSGARPSPSAIAPVSGAPSAATTPTPPAASKATVPDVGLTWQAVDPNPLPEIGQPVAASWSGTRFVIAAHPPTAMNAAFVLSSFSRSAWSEVPRVDAAPVNPKASYGPVRFWTSPDGQSWSTSGQARTGQPNAFAFDGSAGIAVGTDVGDGVIWTSPDGRTWARLPQPNALIPLRNELGISLDGVANGPAGYVAFGSVVHPQTLTPSGFTLPIWSVVFWSPDGREWQREAEEPFGHAYLKDIVTINGRYVISGQAEGSTSLVLWTSSDGRNWTKEPELDGGPVELPALAAVPGEALLAGTEAGNCVAWRSADGIAWTRLTEPCPSSTSLAAGPSGFLSTSIPKECQLAFAQPNLYFCAPAIEVSATGEQWASLLAPTADGDVIAASANKILWTARRPSDDQFGLWIADVPSSP